MVARARDVRAAALERDRALELRRSIVTATAVGAGISIAVLGGIAAATRPGQATPAQSTGSPTLPDAGSAGQGAYGDGGLGYYRGDDGGATGPSGQNGAGFQQPAQAPQPYDGNQAPMVVSGGS